MGSRKLTGNWDTDITEIDSSYKREKIVGERRNSTYKFLYEFLWQENGGETAKSQRKGMPWNIIYHLIEADLKSAAQICQFAEEKLAYVSYTGPAFRELLRKGVEALEKHTGYQARDQTEAAPPEPLGEEGLLTLVTDNMLHAIKAAGAWIAPREALHFLVRIRLSAGFELSLDLYRDLIADWMKSGRSA